MFQQQNNNNNMQGMSILDEFGELMNEYAHEFDKLIGREKEVDHIIATLYQRKKPNPVLIGEAGVGKTQIVEGVVQRIVNGDVLGKLADAHFYLMDVKKLSNALQQGGLSIVNALVNEVREREVNGNHTILFMDEMHLLVGGVSQSNPNSQNPADVLKPALARGDLRVIGATTLAEYRSIEADKALERRFSPILIDELSEEETLEVLEGTREAYEEFHGVTYGEDVFESSVELAVRYMPDRVLPDKAIDVIDKVGARMSSTSDQEGLTFEEERLEYESIHALLKMSSSLVSNNTSEASEWGNEFSRVVESQEELQRQEDNERRLVTKLDVRNFMKDLLGLDTLIEEYTEEEIIEELKSRLVGQDHAVNSVARHMVLANYGFKATDKPKSTMLFYGATGVGKSEAAKQISRIMFGTEDLLVIDGAEFQESHTVSKLTGSPAGYVGYGTPTPLDTLRRKPNQVVLVDEFDKMHHNVKQLFLGVLEEGRMTDGSGNVIPFTETVIIFTTNEHPQENTATKTIGFSGTMSLDDIADQEIASENAFFDDRPQFEGMSPELVNRFDEVIKFNEMTLEIVEAVFDIKFRDFQKTALEEHGWTVNVTEDARKHLIRASYNKKYGARPVNRTVSKISAMVVRHFGHYKATHNGEELNEFTLAIREGRVTIL